MLQEKIKNNNKFTRHKTSDSIARSSAFVKLNFVFKHMEKTKKSDSVVWPVPAVELFCNLYS